MYIQNRTLASSAAARAGKAMPTVKKTPILLNRRNPTYKELKASPFRFVQVLQAGVTKMTGEKKTIINNI